MDRWIDGYIDCAEAPGPTRSDRETCLRFASCRRTTLRYVSCSRFGVWGFAGLVVTRETWVLRDLRRIARYSFVARRAGFLL